MKIKRKLLTSPLKNPRRRGQVDTENTTPDSGQGYKEPVRFPQLSALLTRYERTRERRGSNQSWINIIRQYERMPYKGPDNKILPNFGTLRFKVDKAITTYTDFATERPQWVNVDTDHEVNGMTDPEWGRHIAAAYQKYCNNRWTTSFADIMMACKDMLLFSKGAFVWMDDDCPYPDNVGIEHVWPNASAGMFPKSWDICFVQKRMTAVKLYDKVEDPGAEAASGWRRSSVLRLLASSSDQTAWTGKREAWSPDGQDYEFDLVYAFVTEYRKEGGKKVSKYVFPARSHIPRSKDKKQTVDQAADEQDYLCYAEHRYESMANVIAITAHTVFRKFFDDPSFAQLIYTLSKTYDMVMNRILQAVEDNMRVYLKTTSSQQLEKLQRMRHGNYQALEPGVDIVQERIQRPVAEAAQMLRMVMVDQQQGLGRYEQGGVDEQGKGQRKTAHQAQIDHAESLRIDSSELKIFNCFWTLLEIEKFRRFTNPTENAISLSTDDHQNFLKFRKYLRSRKVPDEAWAMENVQISSVLNLGAGSPSQRERAGQVVLATLQQPAASAGERKAQFDIISSVVGVDNTDAYLPAVEVPIPEDSLIGLENDALSQAMCNPKNVPVIGDQLHFRHIPQHIQDASLSLQAAQGLFQNLGQMPKEDTGVYLKTIMDILVGVDNKLAHARAHMQLASRSKSPSDKNKLQQFAQQVQQLNGMHDKLDKALSQMQQKRLQEGGQQGQLDEKQLEYDHKKRMFDLEAEHGATMLAQDVQRNKTKAEQLQAHSQQRHEADIHARTVDTQVNAALAVEVARSKAEVAKVKAHEKTTGKNGSKK